MTTDNIEARVVGMIGGSSAGLGLGMLLYTMLTEAPWTFPLSHGWYLHLAMRSLGAIVFPAGLVAAVTGAFLIRDPQPASSGRTRGYILLIAAVGLVALAWTVIILELAFAERDVLAWVEALGLVLVGAGAWSIVGGLWLKGRS